MQLGKQRKPPGKIRIVGGLWRGARIVIPDVEQLRPTPDRVRETLFNWLQHVVPGSICLDLFAGSGALGFEAASRGAARVVMVENNRQLAEQLRRQAHTLGASQIEVVCADAEHWLSRVRDSFDLVFLDPPFGQGLIAKVLPLLAERPMLKPDAHVYVEAERGLAIDLRQYQLKKQSHAGQVQYMLLQLHPE